MVLIYSTWFLNVSGKSTMDVYSEFISYLWTEECNAGVYFVNLLMEIYSGNSWELELPIIS